MLPTELEIAAAKRLFYRLASIGLDEVLERSENIATFAWDNASLLESIGVQVCWGCTKAVVISESKLGNWVLKFDYDQKNLGYCKREADYYKIAEERGLQYFFAASYPIGKVFGHDLYLQEWARPDEERFSSMKYEYIVDIYDFEVDDEEKISDRMWEMNEEEVLEAVFGDDIDLSKMLQFVEDTIEHDGLGADFHEGNFGVTKDHRIVIFDYSGY